MVVAGFTFIRNAVRFDYPIVEAIQSILPLCDYVVVAVGASEDGTLALIQGLNEPKIRIIETVWDDTLREGGQVLAVETNKALDAIGADADWCLYIQGDECLHEMFYPELKKAMLLWKNDPETEGLLLKYRHFYGSYDYIGTARFWYRHEIRIIKNDQSIRSYKDAQGFRKKGQKLKVRAVNAYMHHYGWVRHPKAQQDKQLNFNKLWHSDEAVKARVADVAEFDYGQTNSLSRYEGSHPAVFQRRIQALNWQFNFDPTGVKRPFKERLSFFIEKYTGWRIGEYKNYKLLR